MKNPEPTIYLVFVDDWELRGNGSGDARKLQFAPMRELVKLYQEFGIRGSFNAEVMQQLTFRQHEAGHPELRDLANEWEELVVQTYRLGCDIQLHIHPQWHQADYSDGQWRLRGDWSILNYSASDALSMLKTGRDYLERLLRAMDANYRCVSFRSGAWCIAPSPHILSLLVELGIVFDMSIVGGVRYNTRNIQLDYTNCEEDFLPYYPVMTDARKVSNKVEPLICVPTNCFYASRRQVFQRHVKNFGTKVKQKVAPSLSVQHQGGVAVGYGMEWEPTDTSRLSRIYDEKIKPYFTGRHLISDLAQLDYALLTEMLSSIRRRARASGLSEVPVILENHTKDVRDFSDIKRFLNDVVKAPDVRCLTLTELAQHFTAGTFKIRTANH
ncbi:MAG TPA: hypothetical protein VKB46_10610 [Pyrinomonadaceae bacterium]|nr:hypothetical protein [Pyrinomonadaceae bacterium]